MSLYLGKVHYWLYNKITWFEELEKEIINFAESKNLPIKQWKEEIISKYGVPTENKPLEEIIDTSNIHGWLQNKIHSAEVRQAAWVTAILKEKKEYKKDLMDIFKSQGEKCALEYREKNHPIYAEDMYNALNDYILEGMPCDRINVILESNENEILWKANKCLHTPHWETVGGEVENFYSLREGWISAFINSLNNKFHFKSLGNYTYSIKK
ncbi:hypothetical protein CF095_14720 [Clostridium botulinum]|uniref:hypothetical protein n=1 Tax=Clostridium botulinum TaxID=1491 RepID=UPI0007E03266|nr:hypothetical protein [Clostridium botulinum]KEI75801.1 hypothetical protein N486_08455 [Clostridium botulinum B2 128]KEI89558.1 hypothetical protein N493_08670 [Clostridium botulinum B2 433]NFI42413.1 hypothetical protein [Clostridium botulinum]NFI76778.1 hypothetical protein [Clostridium botulinum]NFI84275.1 hypothetical protein [Clostridium botulinum]